ncbi:MAG: DinB family protein [Gemmatimonadales bacterium]
MDKTTFDTIWDQVRQKYGVYVRLIETLPEAQLQTHPIPGMRSPAELIAHLSSGVVRSIMQGIAVGSVKPEDESATALGFKNKKDVLELARQCWKDADMVAHQITNEQLGSMVNAWGMPIPASALVHVLSDELVHHRGQLYVYARLLGAEPPSVWSHTDNAMEFAPRGP